MSNLTCNVRTIIVIVLLDFFLNILLPGLIAYKDHVFYLHDLENKFPPHSRKAADSLRTYKQRRDEYNQRISMADMQISKILQSGANYGDLDALVNSREIYREELGSLKIRS